MRVRPASRSLTDQHGGWCAKCLRYFSRSRPAEFHHMLTKKWVRDRFGSDLDFSWVVPVHRTCHEGPSGLQPRADFMTHNFFERLDMQRSLDERERMSREQHDRGYYWFAVLANIDAINKKIERIDEEQLSRRREFALSSAAGVRGGQNLPNVLMTNSDGDQSPRIQINVANLQAARGHRRAAGRTLEIVTNLMDRLSRREREGLRPALCRRRAQLTRATADACDAVSVAESQYSRDTALVIKGVLAVSSGEFHYAEESLDQLQKRGDLKSWLYQAEERFVRALLWLYTEERNYAEIYSSLCEAQYILVILGLQMSTSPELRLPRPSDSSWDWTPSDVLRSFFRDKKKALGRDECYELRRLTIGTTRLLDRMLNGMLEV